MGLYLRKALRFGPVRINLSKGGVGLSAGVTGARIGVDARGRAYTHAGRYGIYHKQYLSGQHTTAATTAAAAPVDQFVTTDATFPNPDHVEHEPLHAVGDESACWSWLLLIPAALLVGAAGAGLMAQSHLTGMGLMVAMPVIGLLGIVNAMRGGLRRRRRDQLGQKLGTLLAAPGELTDAQLATVAGLANDPKVTPADQRYLSSLAYLDALCGILADHEISSRELFVLNQLERSLAPAADFVRAAKIEAFRGFYLAYVADHDLTPDEEHTLDHIRQALDIPATDLKPELKTITALAELRCIRAGDLPTITPTVKLQQKEICHYEGPGRLLKSKILRSYQQNGQKYKLRGFVIAHEGKLLVTNKRILLVHGGTSAIPLSKVLDIEVEADRNIVQVTRDGAVRPVFYSVPDPLRLGAVLAAASAL